jgi:hypothetical protein
LVSEEDKFIPGVAVRVGRHGSGGPTYVMFDTGCAVLIEEQFVVTVTVEVTVVRL